MHEGHQSELGVWLSVEFAGGLGSILNIPSKEWFSEVMAHLSQKPEKWAGRMKFDVATATTTTK